MKADNSNKTVFVGGRNKAHKVSRAKREENTDKIFLCTVIGEIRV